MLDFDNNEKAEQVLSLFSSLSKGDMAKLIPMLNEKTKDDDGNFEMTTRL